MFRQPEANLLDLEFLMDDHGRRIAAFGYYAGYAGAALGLRVWLDRLKGIQVGCALKAEPWESSNHAIQELKDRLDGEAKDMPRVIILGSRGRCGNGAKALLSACGLTNNHVTEWTA